jgi:two-component system nitrogen regulation response regulator NtrX
MLIEKYAMVGTSASMEQIRKQIQVIGPRNSWVLITGENGTGKENLARNIHSASKRSGKAFVAVNCAAIPEELIESELFGFMKGAFTNAINDKRGKFELAHQGTLFLDEIGDMSLKTQAKILRILQEQSFERVGGQETIHVDVRVIAATNKDLEAEIAAGNFREDLFYRLNVIPLIVPPLRKRGDDIEVLVHHFLGIIAHDLGEPQKSISNDALDVLKAHHWPGNIRELRNLCERMCILVPNSRIELSDLPESLKQIKGFPLDVNLHLKTILAAKTLKEARDEFERSFILDKLEEYEWNVTKTADAIGVERSSLHRKLRAYQIDSQKLKG